MEFHKSEALPGLLLSHGFKEATFNPDADEYRQCHCGLFMVFAAFVPILGFLTEILFTVTQGKHFLSICIILSPEKHTQLSLSLQLC